MKYSRAARTVVLPLLAALVVGPFAAHSASDTDAARSHEPVVSERPTRKEASTDERATWLGVVVPRTRLSVPARVDATVVRIDATIGEPVRRGDVLVTTEATSLATDEREADAAVAEADATVELARSVLARSSERLVRAVRLTDGVAAAQLSERRRSVVEAAVSLARARAGLTRRQAVLDRVMVKRDSQTVRAPTDGIVSGVPVAIGSRVDVDDTVARIVSNAVLVRFAAPAHSVVRPGDRVSIRLDAAGGGLEREAIVARVSPTVDLAGFRLVETNVLAPSELGEIGLRCQVTLLTGR